MRVDPFIKGETLQATENNPSSVHDVSRMVDENPLLLEEGREEEKGSTTARQ
jgi:TusA-related sulfurtransferase